MGRWVGNQFIYFMKQPKSLQVSRWVQWSNRLESNLFVWIHEYSNKSSYKINLFLNFYHLLFVLPNHYRALVTLPPLSVEAERTFCDKNSIETLRQINFLSLLFMQVVLIKLARKQKIKLLPISKFMFIDILEYKMSIIIMQWMFVSEICMICLLFLRLKV